MTRVKISAAVLTALVIMSIISGIWVNRCCNRLIEQLEQLETAVSLDDIENAEETAAVFSNSWENFRRTAAVTVRSDKLTELERLNSRIFPLLECGSEEITAEIEEMSSLIEVLRDGEKPLLTSIF
jgi:hypothetical protein